jgi:hypothetical protein
MAETLAVLEERLRDLAARIDVPPAPPIAPAVIARIETERALRHRPPFPSLALWPRRRVLALATIAIAALLAIAAAARLSIGAIQVQVQPTRSSSAAPPPPVSPAEFGEPIPPADAQGHVGFSVGLPGGPAPDRAFVFRSPFDRNGLIFAWTPSPTYRAIPGLPWGLMLMELTGDDAIFTKTIGSYQDLRPVRVQGASGWWISRPHELTIETDVTTRTYLVNGNVLIWQVENVTYRLETTLGLGDALRLAGQIG